MPIVQTTKYSCQPYNPCSNGGHQMNVGSNCYCQCPPQYTGQYCQQPTLPQSNKKRTKKNTELNFKVYLFWKHRHHRKVLVSQILVKMVVMELHLWVNVIANAHPNTAVNIVNNLYSHQLCHQVSSFKLDFVCLNKKKIFQIKHQLHRETHVNRIHVKMVLMEFRSAINATVNAFQDILANFVSKYRLKHQLIRQLVILKLIIFRPLATNKQKILKKMNAFQ